MNPTLILPAVALVLALGSCRAQEAGNLPNPGGYQPWWKVLPPGNKNLTPEEKRLQKFWHDSSDALRNYYAVPDHIDWVAYYKNHGYQINAGCCGAGGCRGLVYPPVWGMPPASRRGRRSAPPNRNPSRAAETRFSLHLFPSTCHSPCEA
jgi:hypothetical protein